MSVRLQHRHRRDGGITVGSTRYMLDAEGCVEVTEEHSEKMLQGRDWRAPGSWEAVKAPEPPPAASKGVGRRPRTKEEMEAALEAEGLIKPAPPPEVVAPEPGPEPEGPEEALELSMDNTKNELLAVATDLGIEIPRGTAKAQILELIAAQTEE